MVNLWTQLMIGLDSDKISAALSSITVAEEGVDADALGFKCMGGSICGFEMVNPPSSLLLSQRLIEMTQTGPQSIALNIAASLLLKGSIRLSFLQGYGTETFQARKLILSNPTPLYTSITLSPPLPKGTKLGFYIKVIAVYKRPWWALPSAAGKNLCGLLLSYTGPLVVARDTSTPADSQYSLKCFVNGSIGRSWYSLPPHARKMSVRSRIAEITGCEEAMDQLDVLELR
ncbi:hypothetical protein BDV12DRAFT_193469 [Aspergillus spectabilis]